VELCLYSPVRLHDVDRENFIFLICFVLYKICHNPGLSVCMEHLSDVYFCYKNLNV